MHNVACLLVNKFPDLMYIIALIW